MNEISAGTIVTECLYSDRNVYDVIARTEKSLTLRERKPILDKKPVMQTGGFCAVVIENAVWHTEPDTTGMITKAWMRKDGKFHTGMGIVVIGDNYFYDCAF